MVRILLVLLTFGIWSCGSEADTSEGKPAVKVTSASHQKMVNVLADIARNAKPMEFYHLNKQRAELLRQQLSANTDPNKKAQLLYTYANELVSSGQTDQAIAQLSPLVTQLSLKQNTKPFFDLLALAYLRRGEVENCLNNHNEESCVLPIVGGGKHVNTSGSSQAIEQYMAILKEFPDDDQSRYLLNLAHQTLGTKPPVSMRIKGMTSTSIDRQFVDRAGHGSLGVNRLSGGVALGDFNSDGYTDIFATSYGFADDAKLFVSQAEGGFAEVNANLEGIRGGLNCQAADYDNDGDLDVLVLRGGWFGAPGAHPNSLLENDGSGRFTDVTFDVGLGAGRPSQTAAWTDVDLDGDLDLFIGNEASNALRSPCELYLNDGQGGFSESGKAAGVDLVAVAKGVTAGDMNGDQLPDLYVSCLGQPNVLFLNRGLQAGVPLFEKAAASAGVGQPQFSFPTWTFDYDQDGDLDLFVSGYDVQAQADVGGIEARIRLGKSSPEAPLKLYRNDGKAKFTDVSISAGVDRPVFTMGSNMGDLTNDGFPDMYLGTGAPDLRSVVPNLYYVNTGKGSFRENTLASGLGHVQKGHGVGFADFDMDGDLDVYTVLGGAFEGDNFPNALFENQLEEQGAWISLTLAGKQANRSAIGAKIAVFAKAADGSEVKRYHTVNTGGSFGGNALTAHIGLNDATSIERIDIVWPSRENSTQVLKELELNARYSIIQGESALKTATTFRPLSGQHSGHTH